MTAPVLDASRRGGELSAPVARSGDHGSGRTGLGNSSPLSPLSCDTSHGSRGIVRRLSVTGHGAICDTSRHAVGGQSAAIVPRLHYDTIRTLSPSTFSKRRVAEST